MIKSRFNNFPFQPSKSKIFYGWHILILATIGIIMSAPGQTMGVSTFTDHLLEAMGMSRDQLSLAYMLGTIGSSLIITLGGKLYDKIGARWLGIIITWLLGTVLLMLSQVDKIAISLGKLLNIGEAQFYLSFVVILLCFFLLRFSGQGVLTMLSRNMLMKWFVARRGFASGVSSVFVSFGFSITPLVFNFLIEGYNWRNAWIILAIICGFGFSILIFLFFRDNPEDCELKPDGNYNVKKDPKVIVKAEKQFTLYEAKRTLPFWVFVLSLAMFSMYYTGFTFHLISIFEHAQMDKMKALSVFIPTSIISVAITLGGGWLSDRIQLKKLLILLLAGGMTSMASLALLENSTSYVLLIVGNAIMNGLFSVLAAVVWPRFYGREHLGAISGFAMSILVFFSALGPLLFSYSLSIFGGYAVASWICFGLTFIYFLAAFKANNPQEKAE
ncbi:MFS transporter [Sunxiuqinia sp. A32]|uniref:MFS transporter n=1 Tax=Sunxiuqinia sp. A32 TaxID=3461496 RepID=UPI004046182E